MKGNLLMININCPVCGYEMGDLANFCNQCGSQLPPPSEPIDLKEKEELSKKFTLGFCGEIGHKIQKQMNKISGDDIRFCAICGEKINSV